MVFKDARNNMKDWYERKGTHPYHIGDKYWDIYNAYDLEKLTIPHIRRRVFMARPPRGNNWETSQYSSIKFL